MQYTHKCDYCGEKYVLEADIECCKACGQFRMFNLTTNQKTSLYQSSGIIYTETKPSSDDEEELDPKKAKKQSKDIKAKRVSQQFLAAKQFGRNRRV